MKPNMIILKVVAFATLLCAPVQTTSAGYVYITTSSPTVALGGSVTVTEMFMSTARNVLGSDDLAFAYDSTRFTISNVQEGSLVASDFTTHSFNTTVPGILRTSSASGSGDGIAVSNGTSGALLTFTLTAMVNALAGGNVGNLNVLDSYGTTTTNVSDVNTLGAIALSPAPTTGYDIGVDGSLTIVPTGVPEPGSMTLVGIGCLGAAIYHRVRRRRPNLARRKPRINDIGSRK